MSQALVAVSDASLKPSYSIQAGIRRESSEVEYQNYLVNLLLNAQGSDQPPEREIPTERTLTMHHPWHNVPIGDECPEALNAVIEIPAYSRVKTELDHETGLLQLGRILNSSVIYPANYGFVPQTLAEQSDPLDILVLCQLSVPPLSIVRCRPIGVMPLVRSGVYDYKIIAVAISDPEYGEYQDLERLPPFKLLTIVQFFNDYRAMEGVSIKALKPMGREEAHRIVREARTAYRAYFDLEE
jgi:inorganic pyrophosphatase